MAPLAGGMGMGGSLAGLPTTPTPQILLVDGKPKALPTDAATAVRVRALDRADAVGRPSEGQALLALEVSLEPKLRWQQLVGVQVGKALDDQGQSLKQAAPAAADGAGPAAGAAWRGNVRLGGMGGAFAGWRGGETVLGVATQGSRPIQAPVCLEKGAKPAGSLKELSGTVTAQVLGEARALVTVSDVLNSAGQTVKGEGRASIHVLAVEKQSNGWVKLRFSAESDSADLSSITHAGDRVLLGRAAGPASAQHELVLTDSEGTPIPVSATSVTAGGGRVEYLLTYLSRKGQGVPDRLSLRASKVVTVEVPFTLKDVPLP